jgi:hypothetical protein
MAKPYSFAKNQVTGSSTRTTETVAGTLMRVDPAVQNGTVTVDVKLTGELREDPSPI